jgi:dTDP-glucose pyrophosphorylase
MNIIKKITLVKGSTIKKALDIINKGSMRIALVVDGGKLLGVVSDPDIRRAILNGFSLNDGIEKIYNHNPFKCHISDSKEFVIQQAIDKNIYEIPIVDNDNNLVGFETLAYLLKPKLYKNKVVLMVGGLGMRLRPLTESTPKSMLLVGGKPILQTIVESFVSYGFTDIVMCIGYKSRIIQDYFKDGSEFGANIEYVIEDKRMGTIGALSLLNSSQKPSDAFFVMNGDLLTNVNFEHLLEFHRQNKSKATMCVREYDFQVPYGVVNLEGERIISIEEKPIHGFFVNAGIYLLDPKCIDLIPDNQFYDVPKLFEKMIDNRETVVSFPLREYWLDIGNHSDFSKAQIDIELLKK